VRCRSTPLLPSRVQISLISLLLLIVAVTTTGCVGERTVAPIGWAPSSEVDRSPDRSVDHDHGALQIFICYGNGLSSHAALRIAGSDGTVVFWDPGGALGTDPEDLRTRRACLIPDDPPTPSEYFRFRTGWCGEARMEMFQWLLDADEARALHAVLVDGCSDRYPNRTFKSDTPPFACAVAVSAFLQQYRPAGISLRHRSFWPHSLAADLWKQRPAAVWEFRKGVSPRAFVSRGSEG
jgi:hypothetical protein